MDRREKILAGLDVSNLEGAEIGALNRPTVAKTDGTVIYIDHTDTESLRLKYKDDTIDVDSIVNVDAIWGSNTIQEALGSERKLDYIIASHVVEHVPDFVTWLEELSSVLKPGGTIRLVVPDMRFCFDYLRKETRLTDVITAYFNRARRPEIHEIIDWAVHFKPVDTVAAWNGLTEKRALRERGMLEGAFNFARRAQAGEYVDVHCWTFTLESFASLMEELANLELTQLTCEHWFDTEVNDLEFFVAMAVSKDRQYAVNSWARVRAEATKRNAAIADQRQASQRRRIADLEAEIAVKAAELEALRSAASVE